MKKYLFMSLCLFITNALATPSATEIAACQDRVVENAQNTLCYFSYPYGEAYFKCKVPASYNEFETIWGFDGALRTFVKNSQAYKDCSINKMTIHRYRNVNNGRRYLSLYPIPLADSWTQGWAEEDTYTFSVEDNAGTAGFQRLYLCGSLKSSAKQSTWLEQFTVRPTNSDVTQCDGDPLKVYYQWYNAVEDEYYDWMWWSSNVVGHSFTPGTTGVSPVYGCKRSATNREYYLSWSSTCEASDAISMGIQGYAKH